MSSPPSRDKSKGSAQDLVVVQVTDKINPTLAGRGDVSYQSPPLTPDEAQTLVRVLLGRGEGPPIGEQAWWTCPIAGGRRNVTIGPAVDATSRAAPA